MAIVQAAVYGFMAVFIAVALSSVELLTRYRSRSLPEIFWSWHYAGFAALNAFFCLMVYFALPHLPEMGVRVSQPVAEHGLVRAIVAGLGYLVIARISILDIRAKDGTTYGLGFDAIYTGLAEYLLDHHRRWMQQTMHADFESEYQAASGMEREVFRDAATAVLIGLSDAGEKVSFQERLDLAEQRYPEQDTAYCMELYQLIRSVTTGRAEASQRLVRSREKLAGP